MRPGRRLAAWVGAIAVAGFGLAGVRVAGRQATVQPSSLDRSLLDRYSIPCHNSRQQTAGLAFDTRDPARAAAEPPIWERVARELRSGTMPPPGRPRPDRATSQAFAAALEAEIDAAAATSPWPGRPVIHRLNR